MSDRPIVLSLCDRTGNMVQPWLDAGYECWIVDVQHPAGQTIDGRLVRFGMDVRDFRDADGVPLAMAFAFPPCTDLSVSGARVRGQSHTAWSTTGARRGSSNAELPITRAVRAYAFPLFAFLNLTEGTGSPPHDELV